MKIDEGTKWLPQSKLNALGVNALEHFGLSLSLLGDGFEHPTGFVSVQSYPAWYFSPSGFYFRY